MEDSLISARAVGGKGLNRDYIPDIQQVALIQSLIGNRRLIMGQISGEAVSSQIGYRFVAIAGNRLLYCFADRGCTYSWPHQFQRRSQAGKEARVSFSWPLSQR